MARFVYDASLVSMTLDKLNDAYNELENTEMEIDRGVSMICSATGSELMDIDFSPILNYYVQVTGSIDDLSTNIKNTAQQIEDYQNAPWHKKLFSTLGMTGLKLIEGIGGVIENLGDGLVSIAGFAGGLFNSEFKDACAEFVKKDYVGDAFSNAYESGALQNINKYSIYSHESTAANVFKGFGTAAAYVGISLVTGGASLAKEVAIEASIAAVTGIGQGTQDGLQAGKTFNSAFGEGLKTGVMAAAGEAVMGVAMNKIMKIPEVQNAIGSVVQKFSKAKAKFTSKALKNTDEVVTALTVHSDEVVEAAAKSDNLLTAGKKADEILEAGTKVDEIVESSTKLDEAVTVGKKSDEVVEASVKADEVVDASTKTDGQYRLTKDEIIQDDLAKTKAKPMETPKVQDVDVKPTKQVAPTQVDEIVSSGKATDEVVQPKTTDGQYRLTKDQIIQDDLAKPKSVETPKVQDVDTTPAKQTTPTKVDEVVQPKTTDGQYRLTRDEIIQDNLVTGKSVASTKVDEVVSSVAVHSDEASVITDITSGKTNIPSSVSPTSATKVAGSLGDVVSDIPAIPAASSASLVGTTGTMMRAGLNSADELIGAGLKSTDDIIAQTDEVVDATKKSTTGKSTTSKKKAKVNVTESSDELDEVVGATKASAPTSADLSKVKRSMDEMGGRLVKKQETLTSAQEALKAAKASGADDATIAALQKNVDKAQRDYTRQYDSLMKKQKQYIEMTESGQFNKIGTEGKHKLIIGEEVVAGPNSVDGNITTMRAKTELGDGTIETRPNWTDATAKSEGQINKREFSKLLDEEYGPVKKTPKPDIDPTKKPDIDPEPTKTIEPQPTKTVEPSPTKTVEPEPTKTVEPEPTKTVEPEPTKTVEPEPTKTVEPEPTKTVEPEPTKTVEPEPTKTVEPEPTKTVEPEPTKTVEPEPTKTVEPEPTKTVEPEPTKTVEPEPTKTVEPEPTKTVEPEPTKTVEPEPTKTVEPEPTKTVEPEPTKTVEPEPTKTVEPEPTKTVEPEPTKTVEPEPTKTVEPEPTKTVEPEPTKTVEPEPTKTVEPEPTKTVEPDPTKTVEPSPTPTYTKYGEPGDSETLYKHDYKKVTEEIGPNGEKITTTTELAGTPQQSGVRSIEYPDGTSKTEILKDGKWVDAEDVVPPKGDISSSGLNNVDEVSDVVEEVATHTDEATDVVEEVVTHTDEATDVVEEVVTHTDEASDVVEEVATHTDEAADVVEEVVTHTDEVTDVVEEVVTHTDEATDVVEEVVTHTDEATDVVEEVATHTDEFASARKELETELADIKSRRQAASETLESLQKQSDELQTQIATKEAQRQTITEQFNQGLERYNYAKGDVVNLIDELAPNGIHQPRPGVIEPSNSLAQSIADYYEQGSRIMQRGTGTLDPTELNNQLQKWYRSNAADIENARRISQMSGQYYDVSKAMNNLTDEYNQMLKRLTDYTNSISDAAPAAKQMAQLSDEITKLRGDEFALNRQIRNTTRQIENLGQNADEIVSQIDELKIKPTNVIDEVADVIEEVGTHTDEVAGVIEEVGTHTDEVSDVVEEVGTHTDEVSDVVEEVGTHTDEVSDVVEEIGTHTDEVSDVVEEVGTHTDEVSDVVEEIGTHTDEVSDVVEEVGTHTDEVSDVVEEVGTHTDEVSDVVEEVGTHTDEVSDIVEEVGTHTDEVSDVVEDTVTKIDETLETKTGAESSKFDSGLEDVTGTKATDLKVSDDVEVVDISTPTNRSTASHFDEIVASAEESASKVFGHSNFDEILEPVKYGDEVTESLFGENPGKRFEDLSRKKDSDISRLDKLQRDNYYYQESLHSMRNKFSQWCDGQLSYDDLDSWIYKMRGEAEDFFGQYKSACRNTINSGSNNFSTRLINGATSADDVLDLRKVQLFDDYELDYQYRTAKQRLEYEAEEMIAESFRYGRDEYSDIMRHISRKQDILDTNYRRLKNFSQEFSEMQDDMVRTYRNTVEEVRTIDTDLSKAYRTSQYEQLSAIKATPTKTYTTFEEYAKTMNLDGIVNPNGSGIIKLGDVEIKATPDMIKRISSELGTEGMSRVKTGVITVNDVQDIQKGIIESIRSSAGDLDVSLPNRPSYIKTLGESFTRPSYGIGELNEVNQYLGDIAKHLSDETVSQSTGILSKSLGDTGIASKFDSLFSDGSRPNGSAIKDVLRQASEPSKIMKFSDVEDLLFGTSKSTDDLSSLFKDGPTTPKKTTDSLDLDDLFGASKKADELPAVFDDSIKAGTNVVEEVGTHSDEVVDVVEEVATHTDEVADVIEEVGTHTDEVADVIEEVGTHTDEVADVIEEVGTHTDEVADVIEEVGTHTDEVADVIEEVGTHTDEVADVIEEVGTHTDEVADVIEEVGTHTDEVADVIEEVGTHTDEVADVIEEVGTHTDEVAGVIEEVGTHTDEVADVIEEVGTHTDEAADVVEEVATHSDELITPTRSEELFESQSRAVGNAEYVEESSLFSRKNNAKNVFNRNEVGAQMNIPTQRPVLTELQQQWVDYLNYEISMGRTPVALFNSTTEISSAMLSKIDDLSQVKIQLLDGLGDGNGMLKPKYNAPQYIDRVTYSGHEMNAIVKRLEQLQSKIDMSLPPSQRAKQIYDILSTEVPVMHDFGDIPNGHQISASLRGLTPVNSAGKEGLVCAGYSSVYKELCERADIACDYIRGKGNSDPLRGGRAGGHAWNVVHTEIGDIPVDVTWSACNNGSNKWFGASEDFASTHWSNPDELYQDFSSSSMTPRHAIGSASDKMDNVVSILEQKYGSRSEALSRLENYVNSGDPHMITRTDGARDIILSTEPSYVQNYVYYARQNNSIQQIIDTMNYRTGNSTSGYTALRKYLETGNPQLITRTNGARDLLSSLNPDIINQYLTGLGW